MTVTTELDRDTCLRLLERHHVGRIAVNGEEGPLVVPVNYVVDGRTVVIRSDLGVALEVTGEHDRGAFEIDGIDEGRRLGWSVLVRGRLREITAEGELEQLRELPVGPSVGGAGAHFLRLDAATITGRRVELPPTLPHDWFEVADLGNVWFDQDGSDLLG